MVPPGGDGVPDHQRRQPGAGLWGGAPLAGGAGRPREERADLWGERPHALGRLPGPLYQFVGSFPQLLEAQGAQLTQGEERYRVLGAQEVTLGGRRLFERALLERWVEV